MHCSLSAYYLEVKLKNECKAKTQVFTGQWFGLVSRKLFLKKAEIIQTTETPLLEKVHLS